MIIGNIDEDGYLRATDEELSGILKVSEAELALRKAAWKAPAPRYARGYGAAFSQHITQANEGCDFDFLEAGAETPDPEIH